MNFDATLSTELQGWTLPWRETGFGTDLRKEKGRETGVRGRLEHHSVAHGERRADFPGKKHQRKVPRNNLEWTIETIGFE